MSKPPPPEILLPYSASIGCMVEGGTTELPTGTVTFLLSDVEGSTRLWEEHHEVMGAAVARHDEILRLAVEAHRGTLVKTKGEGDSTFTVFARATDAASAAVEAQEALGAEVWAGSVRLRVRAAMHTGEAELRDGDYFGEAVNRAARLREIAHGGQTLLSQVTYDLVQDQLASGARLIDLGSHRLRDLARPEHVWELRHAGLEGVFPPLRSLDAVPNNLPAQVSSFIGRDREVERTIAALDEARVVTLTGVGGVGKTRLALEVASQVLTRFREGAWLVELGAIRDPDGVAGAVAGVFGVSPRAGLTLEESLAEFLRPKELLLIADNCEHLLEAVGELVEMLERGCAGLSVLATSREGLALDGERVVPVPSLKAPPAGADPSAAAQADAVRLFVDRAGGADPDFTLTADNAAAVVQVCRRLDGVPLAIELAAARVAAMTPVELAQGLDRRFETLAGGRRRAVQRHQTLRAAIDWSYDLLSDGEQRLLARLAVFAGGCTRDAAEAVCGDAPIGPGHVFELLVGLVAKSLVVAQRDTSETRYRLLETIREYGEQRLAEHGETEAWRGRHAEHYGEFTLAVSGEVLGPRAIEAARRLAAEYENVLAAMNHAIDTKNVDLALRLLLDTPTPTVQLGYQLVFPVEAILALDGAADHPLYAYGLALAASRSGGHGDPGWSATCEEALAAAERLASDPDQLVEELVAEARGNFAVAVGAWDESAIHFERAGDIARSHERLGNLAIRLMSTAMGHTMAGDLDAAVPLATEGLTVARRVGGPVLVAMNLMALAGALADRDPVRARGLLAESVQLRESLELEPGLFVTQGILIAARIEDWPLVLELATGSIRHLHWTGDRPYLAGILNVVARAVSPADPEAAGVLQGAARRLAVADGIPASVPGPASSTDALAAGSKPSGAASFVTEIRRQTTNLLRDSFGEARLRELRAEGEAMDDDHAVAFALDAIASVRAL